MPMNTLGRARHLNSSASAPIRKVITPCRITIALFTSVMSLSNIIGLLRRWTMDFASWLLSRMSNPAGYLVGAQNSWARASSSSTTAARRFCQKSSNRVGDQFDGQSIETAKTLGIIVPLSGRILLQCMSPLLAQSGHGVGGPLEILEAHGQPIG